MCHGARGWLEIVVECERYRLEGIDKPMLETVRRWQDMPIETAEGKDPAHECTAFSDKRWTLHVT